MAKKNTRSADEVKGDVNMSPMIDCCFLLLIFFVVNATQITVSKDPSVKMPSAVACNDMKDAKGCIVVNIFGDTAKMEGKAKEKFLKNYGGKTDIWWGVDDNGKKIGYTKAEADKLQKYIEEQKKFHNKKLEDKDIKLYLRGDRDAEWIRSSGVIAAGAKAGVTNVVFGTLPSR